MCVRARVCARDQQRLRKRVASGQPNTANELRTHTHMAVTKTLQQINNYNIEIHI